MTPQPAFTQLKKIVIGEADHISRSPLAVIPLAQATLPYRVKRGFP
jgi:hypothetical protein